MFRSRFDQKRFGKRIALLPRRDNVPCTRIKYASNSASDWNRGGGAGTRLPIIFGRYCFGRSLSPAVVRPPPLIARRIRSNIEAIIYRSTFCRLSCPLSLRHSASFSVRRANKACLLAACPRKARDSLLPPAVVRVGLAASGRPFYIANWSWRVFF